MQMVFEGGTSLAAAFHLFGGGVWYEAAAPVTECTEVTSEVNRLAAATGQNFGASIRPAELSAFSRGRSMVGMAEY